jgi:hypothetical protein
MLVMTCWFHSVGQCFRASGSLVPSEAEIMAAVERGMCLRCAVLWRHPFTLSTYCRHVLQLFQLFLPSDKNCNAKNLSLYSNMSKYNLEAVFSSCT